MPTYNIQLHNYIYIYIYPGSSTINFITALEYTYQVNMDYTIVKTKCGLQHMKNRGNDFNYIFVYIYLRFINLKKDQFITSQFAYTIQSLQNKKKTYLN